MNEPLPDYYAPIVKAIAQSIYEDFPNLNERYGEKGWKHTLEDNEHHFRHLEAAYAIKDQQVFIDYAIWLNGILTKHGMTTYLLIDNFERIPPVIYEQLEKDKEASFNQYVDAAIDALKQTEEYSKSERIPFRS